jgi:hypothetical protein
MVLGNTVCVDGCAVAVQCTTFTPLHENMSIILQCAVHASEVVTNILKLVEKSYA